jgi:predicted transposase/invertase (TIGR01784 family)
LNYFSHDRYHSSYHIRDDVDQSILTNDLEMHFIELKKFKFSDIKKLKRADTWIAYFSSECTDEERKVIATTNPAIKETLNYEVLFSQDEVKRREYELQEKAIRDYNATMLYNRKEGKQEGKQEEKRESVLRYLKLGISPEIISRGSELSLQEVLNLQKTLSQN